MAKEFNLVIDKYQAEIYMRAIRSKRDVIFIWMETIKNFLIGQPPAQEDGKAQLSILIDSMSRLFCTLGDGRKIFSIAFPFTARANSGQLSFFSREGVEIDSQISSNIISLIDVDNVLTSPDFGKFIDPIMERSDLDPNIWSLIRELMISEDGYIRYDWDEERSDGHRHPLHHLDINYSNGGTFKVGLNSQMDRALLASMIDAGTDCHYLRPAEK